MSGNVWELCWDWHDDYTSADKTNPTGPSSGYDRVIRGGGFIEERSPWNPNSAQGVRSLTRCGNNLQLSSALNMNDGFRLVLPGN
jgi:formylglycine-generating enzyme required for sulfatase activity